MTRAGLRLPRPTPEPATIGICALSGRVEAGALERAVAYLRDLGNAVVVAPQASGSWRYFAGHDDERLAGFESLLGDGAIDLVMAARGGYGITRLLGRIDWNRVAESGKAFVGFSDFTAFNMAAYACANLLTFHGPMAAVDFGSRDPDSFTQQHFWLAIGRDEHRIDDIPSDHGYEARRIEGRLWGGNLSMLTHLLGTPYFPAIEDGILYVEEVAEEPYAVERMFFQLLHAGVMGRQNAVLLGDFSECRATNPVRYPYSMEEVLETLRSVIPCPVLTGLPFGHVPRKATLPFGAPATLTLGSGGYSLRFFDYTRK